MKRFLLFVVATALLVGCEGAPLPTESPDLKKGNLPDGAAPQAQINTLINALFDQPDKREAHRLFAQVKRGMASGDEEYAQEKAGELMALATHALAEGRVNDPGTGETPEQAVHRLLTLLLEFVGLEVPDIPEDICDLGDCVVAIVPPTGGTVVTNTGFAGAEITDEALDESIVVSIYRIDQEPCLLIDLPQFKGCYRFEKSSEEDFDALVTLGVCADLRSLDDLQSERVLLHKFDPETEEVTALAKPPTPGGEVDFLDCTDFFDSLDPIVGLGSSGIVELAKASWEEFQNGLATLFGPEVLHASVAAERPKRLGGMTGSFTDVAPALPAVMEVHEGGEDQTAGVNSPVPVLPAVRVSDVAGDPVENATVHFEATSTSIVEPAFVVTGSDGIAQVTSWTLGSAPGTYTLTASGVGIAGPEDGAPFVPVPPAVEVTLGEGTINFIAAAVPVPDGVVSWWPADDNYFDIVGGNHGAPENDPVGFDDGIFGDAFQFTGPNDVIGFSGENLRPLQQLTVAAWVNLDGEGPASATQRFVTLFHEKAVLRQEGSGGEDRVLHFYMNFSPASLPFNQWDLQGIFYEGLEVGCFNHVAGTYDGSVMRLYLNGVLVGTNHVVGTVNDDGDGGHFSNGPEPLIGLLDEVQVYDHAVSAEDIQGMYDAGGTGTCAPPSPGFIDFETLPGGAPLGTLPVALTDQYESEGVVFSYIPSPGLELPPGDPIICESTNLDPSPRPVNHSVHWPAAGTHCGSGRLGTIRMTYAGLPSEVRFIVRRVVAPVSVPTITGLDEFAGAVSVVESTPIPYTTAGEISFQEQTVTVTKLPGGGQISQIDVFWPAGGGTLVIDNLEIDP